MMHGRLGNIKSLVTKYENSEMLKYWRKNPLMIHKSGNLNNISRHHNDMWFLSMKEIQCFANMCQAGPKTDMRDLVDGFRVDAENDDDIIGW